MIVVPVGYGLGPALFSNEEVRGGSAWGAGTFANGDGSRQPSKLELDLAEYQVGSLHLSLLRSRQTQSSAAHFHIWDGSCQPP